MAASRVAIIAGNWKMNYGPRQAANFAAEIIPAIDQVVRDNPNIMCILCPPSISLTAVRETMNALPTQHIELGAQNMYYEEKGAFTGEISPGMVKELCTAIILGHSERRTIFGESDELVNQKLQTAIHYRLLPIVCIGENLDQYEAGETQEVIRRQLLGSLANLSKEQSTQIVIAYEPIWAIGTGRAATARIAGDVAHFIRKLYGEMYGKDAADAVRILYGGSVTSENISEFIAHPDIDGGLVGGASLKQDFVEIVRKSAETIKQ